MKNEDFPLKKAIFQTFLMKKWLKIFLIIAMHMKT